MAVAVSAASNRQVDSEASRLPASAAPNPALRVGMFARPQGGTPTSAAQRNTLRTTEAASRDSHSSCLAVARSSQAALSEADLCRAGKALIPLLDSR